jgi:hypothetical protein
MALIVRVEGENTLTSIDAPNTELQKLWMKWKLSSKRFLKWEAKTEHLTWR